MVNLKKDHELPGSAAAMGEDPADEDFDFRQPENVDQIDLLSQRTPKSLVKENKVFFHPNQVQTASMVTDAEGKLQARMRYLPYGMGGREAP